MLTRIKVLLPMLLSLPALLMTGAVAQDADETGGAAQATGEAVGSAISTVPGTVSSFFAGVGEGAGVHGMLDWAALLIGISFLISVFRGIKRGRIVGPAVRGLVGIALMGWAVS
ncbi:MAG: hypothetical protein AAGG55_05090 [Pseudomonadota bacterium]